MNATGNVLCNSSVIDAPQYIGVAADLLRSQGPAVLRSVDAFPMEPNELAGMTLNAREQEFWHSMRAVEKRRQEWLLGRYAAKDAVRSLLESQRGMKVPLSGIAIVPDAFGCPRVQGAWVTGDCRPSISIAHSQGVAVALATLSPGALAGVDLESLSHRRENYESIAFSPDERNLLASLSEESRQEWALRMWCAKEAAGKALGRGLSSGLLTFHITRIQPAPGRVELELRDGALEVFPWLRGKTLHIYTARESNFVFSAIIYQQGAVRMRPSRQEILDYLLHKMGELTQDWDYNEPVRPESLLFTELGFESLDAVVLCTAIQEHYHTPMPFAELLAEIGQHQRDLSIVELTDFVDTHLGGAPEPESVTRRVQ